MRSFMGLLPSPVASPDTRSATATLRLLFAQSRDLLIQLSISPQQRHETSVRHQKRRPQRYRTRAGSSNHATTNSPQLFDPFGKLTGIAYRSRQQQHANSRWGQNDRFLPDMAAIFVSEIMRLIEYNQIDGYVFAATQRIEELIPKNLGGPDYQRRAGILFAIAGKNAHLFRAELFDELCIF